MTNATQALTSGDGPPAGEAAAPHLTRKAKLVILGALVPVVIAVAVLPLLLLTVPDPHPVKIPGLAGEITGTYVQRGDGVYKLFPYTAPLMSFPTDALVVDETRPQVVIKSRRLDFLSSYGITTYDGSTAIAVEKTVDEGGALHLQPVVALGPGEYVIVASRDSADAGRNYFYFRVP